MLLASTTRRVPGSTPCFVELGSLRLALDSSRMIAVPVPAGKLTASMLEDFMQM